jgi:hypothetical protein
MVIVNVPDVAKSVAGTATVSDVDVCAEMVSAVVPHVAVVEPLKPVPVMTADSAAAPGSAVLGATLAALGVGLLTVRVTLFESCCAKAGVAKSRHKAKNTLFM